MKKFISALFVVLPITATALETPADFSDTKIVMPQLSLAESALERLPRLVFDLLPVEGGAVLSRMPIIVPPVDVDPTMVKAPDSSVEYKLTVKTPEIEPAK
jgi:hypothetical protein